MKTLKVIVIFCILSFGVKAQEKDYKAAVDSVDRDIKAEMNALNELRQAIAVERPNLATETEKIASELREKRRRSQLASQERDALIHELSSLSSEVRMERSV